MLVSTDGARSQSIITEATVDALAACGLFNVKPPRQLVFLGRIERKNEVAGSDGEAAKHELFDNITSKGRVLVQSASPDEDGNHKTEALSIGDAIRRSLDLLPGSEKPGAFTAAGAREPVGDGWSHEADASLYLALAGAAYSGPGR